MNRNRILLWALLGLVMSLGVAVSLSHGGGEVALVPQKEVVPEASSVPETEVDGSAAVTHSDALRPWSPPTRIAYPRNTRLLPTQGSGPKNYHAGRWQVAKEKNMVWCVLPTKLFSATTPMPLVSPRRYYVIALRRLLC